MTTTKTQETERKRLLAETVEHVDIAKFDSTPLVEAMRKMSFTSRDLGRACDIFLKMLADEECSIVLSLAGSASSGGCMQVWVEMLRHNTVLRLDRHTSPRYSDPRSSRVLRYA